jgi:hypothetical protein
MEYRIDGEKIALSTTFQPEPVTLDLADWTMTGDGTLRSPIFRSGGGEHQVDLHPPHADDAIAAWQAARR